MEEKKLLEKKTGLKNVYFREKALARKLVKSGKYEQALRQIEFLSSITWQYPILKEFIDDELESMLADLSTRILTSAKFEPLKGVRKRAVLYSGQIVDSGGLTEQYLNFLISNDYEILFIVQDHLNTMSGRGILQRLSRTLRTSVLILESGSKVQKVIQLHRAIIEFNPDFSFLHFLPNDVVGHVAFSQITGRPRYYIVHNDHTSWLGKACGDYFFEFRQIGAKKSENCRKISKSKLVNLPFYPISNKIDFEGFPFDRCGKIVGVSGGLLKKYFRDPELTYFKKIKNLIKAHPSFVFCLCGRGTVKQVQAIDRFVETYDLQDRFYYLGHRHDFYPLVGNADILFESYPQRGGLVALFALEQQKPVIGIGSEYPYPGSLEHLLDVPHYRQPQSFEEFEKEASRLITDSEYRKSNVAALTKNNFNRRAFEAKLSDIIQAGFTYRDSHTFVHNLKTPSYALYDFLYNNNSESLEETLCRMKYKAFTDHLVLRRLVDSFYTIRFQGFRYWVKCLQNKLFQGSYFGSR